MGFDRPALHTNGFTGWTHFADLPSASVPSRSGIYLVFRESLDPPTFLARSPAGHFKGRDPTVPVSTLAAKWVAGAHVMNIGMATNLSQRLDSYRRYGQGQPVGHQGGRYIWRLADAADLLVAWKSTEGDPADAEAGVHGRVRRFALRQPQRGAKTFGHTEVGHCSLDRRRGGIRPQALIGRPTFMVAGRAVTISPDDIRQALRGVGPEPVQVWAVEVDGKLYPVVQALEAATAVPRSSTRSARARAVLTALGFRLIRV